ncbi:MAG: transposase [Kosmotogaceae bacterium]
MARTARIVFEGIAHHVVQRSNFQLKVFKDEKDKSQYCQFVNEFSKRYKLKIYAYCIMDNHIHFVAVPENSDSLAMTFKNAHMRYSQYFNKKNNQTGHLWQGRFYSCPLDEKHSFEAMKYVERNPVRAGIVKAPWKYFWCSAYDHVQKNQKTVSKNPAENENKHSRIELSDSDELGYNWDPKEWKEYLGTPDKKEFVAKLRSSTKKGSPVFGVKFKKKIENKYGINLDRRPRGRPKKKEKSK